jgi:hypothetical protein
MYSSDRFVFCIVHRSVAEDRHKKLEQTGAGLESNLARDTVKKVGGTWRGSGAKSYMTDDFLMYKIFVHFLI